jgi:hypothetical protein
MLKASVFTPPIRPYAKVRNWPKPGAPDFEVADRKLSCTPAKVSKGCE